MTEAENRPTGVEPSQSVTHSSYLLLVGLLLALVFVVSRFYLALKLPPFVDELLYLRFGQLFITDLGNWNYPLRVGLMPLYPWIAGLLQGLPLDPLLIGRGISIASGLIVLWALHRIERDIFGRSGLFAAALWIFCPYALFHESLGLVDPLFCMLALLLLLTTIKFFTGQLKLPAALLLGLLPALAIVAKAQGYFLLSVPLLGLLLLAESGKPRRTLKTLALAVIPLVLVCGPVLVARVPFAGSFAAIFLHTGDAHILTPDAVLALPWEKWLGQLLLVGGWFGSYQGIIPSLLLAAAIIGGLLYREKLLLLLLWCGVAPIILTVLLADDVASRNILFALPPLFLLLIEVVYRVAAWEGWSKIIARWRPNLMAQVLLIGVVLALGLRAAILIANPAAYPLPAKDQEQYLFGWPSMGGLPEIVQEARRQPGDRPLLYAPDGASGLYLMVYGGQQGDFQAFQAPWWLSRPLLGQSPDGLNVYRSHSQMRESFGELDLANAQEVLIVVRDAGPEKTGRFISLNPQSELLKNDCGPLNSTCYSLYRVGNPDPLGSRENKPGLSPSG